MSDDGLHSVRAELHPQPTLAALLARLEREFARLEREFTDFQRLVAAMLASPPGLGSGPPALRLVTRADGPDEGSLDGNQDKTPGE